MPACADSEVRTPLRAGAVIAGGATIAGCLAASAALGIALPRAAGAGAAALSALVGVVSAILLLGVAAWLLIRATRRWGRLVLLPWIAIVLVAVYALSIAFAAVYPRHPQAGEVPSGAVPVSMTASDGVELAGWYLPTQNGAAVVLRHGAGSRTADAVLQARALHDEGYGVLATDARGHGASGGQGMDLGWYGEVDTRAAVDFLGSRADVDPERIAVVGLSMGGEEAIGAAGVDERICAVVAEGATGRTAADKAWLVEEYGVAGAVQSALDVVTYGVIDMLTPAVPPATLAASIDAAPDTSFLLIAAGEVRDEQLVAERLEQIAPGRVSVWVAEGAHHSQAIRSAPEQWRSRVGGFLASSLHVCESRPSSAA